MADPYGRAIRDHQRGEQTEPLFERYGNDLREHSHIESIYFSEFTAEGPDDEWIASWLDGPLLDIGAGAGRHALYFQELFETVAIEVSEHLVEVLQARGVADARQVSMFSLRGAFERDRFQSVLMIGTQLGLVGSMHGLREFLSDLAYVTGPDASAVLDGYHPELAAEQEFRGFRSDPTPGLAFRILQFQYQDEIGAPLLFRFFSHDRLREVVIGTDWTVDEVRLHPSDRSNPVQYRAALSKQDNRQSPDRKSHLR